jgi:hypothetical protein
MRTENALFYKFEIDYHYDSRIATPNNKGEYVTEKYSGQQIELTDENGNLLDDTYKYDIYVKAHASNPRIYSIRVYMHKNTDKEDTIKIRYNHIDKVVPDGQVQSVRQSIELYTNKTNSMSGDSQTKQMLEGGKLRVINGTSAYEKVDRYAVDQYDSEGEVFAVIPKDDGSGYKIVVPQKSEADPRIPRIFSHRVMAQYKGYDGQEVTVSVGHITDWSINPEALLDTERQDYSGEWKNIGMPAGNGKLNAKDMIELSLPFGTPSIPSDAEFYIEDDKGNLMYNVTVMNENTNVDTQVNEVMSKTVEAKDNNAAQNPWKNAMQDNSVIRNNPFAHRASIIPERQKTKWGFTWEANGQGYTERTTNYKTNWQLAAEVGFKKSINPQTLDLLDKSKWSTIGNDSDVNKWQYTFVPDIGKNVIEYLDNANDIMGFYQRKEMIDGKLEDLMSKKDYQFSTRVRLTDPVDDDAIGLMFRVRDSQNYYMFVWEKNEISTTNKTYEIDHGEGIVGTKQGCGRINLDEYGYTAHFFDPAGISKEDWQTTNDKSKYLYQRGFQGKHKKIFKATPSTKAPSANTEDWNGSTRYPTDKTSCEFEDITSTGNYSAKGWEYNKDYKITVVVTGNTFRIYINEDVNSEELGSLVCEASDDTHQEGSYGIFCVSQRWTYWYDLKMTEILMDNVFSKSEDVILTDTKEKKLSNYMAQDIMKPYIDAISKEEFGGAPYEVFGYSGKSEGEFDVRIDSRTNFVYGKTNNPAAGAVVRTDWTTDDNGLIVKGTGTVEYHEDGHFTIVTDPIQLPTDQVPASIKGFSWNEPSIKSGENVSIKLLPPSSVEVTASVPPITLIGRPYVLNDDMILKSEGIKHLQDLFGDEGFYNELEIPNDIPKDEVLLRIERGRLTGLAPNGNATVENPEYRVNYRFRCEKDGFTRLPVDQFQDQIGINRLRLKSIIGSEGNFDSSINVDVVAWTVFEELEAVPLFAIKVEEEKKIEIEKPRVETRGQNEDNWYLRVKKGKFVKRITLPYHDLGSPEKVPEIYVAYPQLYGMVGKPDQVVEVDLEYSIPEYTDQEFHNRPYTLIDKEVPTLLNEYAIQTRYAPLVLKSETGVSFLEVYSIRANQRRQIRVSDVDAAKGIIYLLDRIREQDDVFVRYAYREDWFTYRGFVHQKYLTETKIIEKPMESSMSYGLSASGQYTYKDEPKSMDGDEEKITKQVSGNYKKSFKDAYKTGASLESISKIVDEIAVKDIIDMSEEVDVSSFELNIIPDVINSENVSTYSFYYKSDGLSISDRTANYRDVVMVRVNYDIPVEKEYTLIPSGDAKFFHLDLNPTPGHFHTVAKNGFHRWIPINTETERFTIDPKNNNNIELLVKQMHVYLRPYAIRRVDTQSNIMATGEIISGTALGRTIYHTDEEWWFNPKDYKYDPTMLRLGKVTLQANSTMKDNMTILDTRTRGGGLDESLSKEIIRQVNEESTYHWDIGYFDGEAYQENGVMIIRLPRSILKSEDNPSGFHESDVQEAVAQHKGFGLLPIVEYYDEVVDESKLNLIPNNEFKNNKHIGYYDPLRSSGEADLLYMKVGSGDNYVLRLKEEEEYAVTIPGYKFTNGQYRLDIKAMKEATAPTRSAGTVEIFYKDGTSRKIQLVQINRSQWMVYKEYLEVSNNVHHVTITLNKTPEVRTGNVIIDYISLVPSESVDEEATEIHEI